MAPHWSNLTCFLIVDASFCFHLVVAKPSGGEFINSCVSSFFYPCIHQTSVTDEGFPGGSVVKNLPAKVGDRRQGLIPGSGRSPGGGNGNLLQDSCHRRIFLSMEEYSCPWKIPWTEEPGRLEYKGSQRVERNWMTEHITGELLSCTNEFRRCWLFLARSGESGMIVRQRSCRAWKMWSFLPGTYFWVWQ